MNGGKSERVLLVIPFFFVETKEIILKLEKNMGWRKGRYTFVTEMGCVFRDVVENFQMQFKNSGNDGFFRNLCSVNFSASKI
jgi:hypothetical protein